MNKNQDAILELVTRLTQNSAITPSQPLLDEGVIDSLTTIELITKLEELFQVTIESDDLNHHNFNTVENMAALIDKKLEN